jgi:hypothetical protein
MLYFYRTLIAYEISTIILFVFSFGTPAFCTGVSM